MTYDSIIYEKKDRIGRITLNRPEKMNSLSDDLLAELDMVLQEVREDIEVSVVVFKGAGRTFSAGYDLTPTGDRKYPPPPRLPGISGTWQKETADNERWFAVWNLPKPTIAQVHGYSLAGGTELAAACDLVVCADDAQFGYPIIRGTGTPPCLLWAYLMNQRKLREYIFTGDYIRGDEAVELGLANYAFPLDRLEDEVNALAEKIAKVPLELLALNKAGVNAVYEAKGFREAINHCFALHIIGHSTETVKDFGRTLMTKGLKAALSDRDGAFKE